MKLKFGLAALALVAMPSLAMPACSYGKEKQAFSCAQGSTWDSATNTCVPTSS